MLQERGLGTLAWLPGFGSPLVTWGEAESAALPEAAANLAEAETGLNL